MVPWQHK